jgi:hypothetical protein
VRFNEFKQPTLKAYRIVVLLSDNSSAETLIYSDTPENAWLIASKQCDIKNIISVNDLNRPRAVKPTDKPSTLQSRTDRFRKFTRLDKKGHPTEVLIRRGQRRMQYAIDIQKECWLKSPNHLGDVFPGLATPSFAVGGRFTVTL